MSVIAELQARGFIEQVSDPRLDQMLAAKPHTVYCGFDPTADSLHVGNLVPIMALAHFQRQGHKVIALVGGATGMIGDPSGRSSERNLQSPEQIEKNLQGIRAQLARFLDFSGPNAAIMVNNYDWTSKMSFIDWLREVGKYFTVNYMLAKESVKSRIETEQGISFTEFSYMTMQAYDFLHLFDTYNCSIQVGGSDQWGNITAGTDLIRKTRGGEAYAVTFPLITTSTGEKFGKSAGNSVWLDAARSSPYQLYQYFIRTADADVERFLKLFSFMDVARIMEVVQQHQQAPERREGQKVLAAEITRVIHGQPGLDAAKAASDALFGGELTGLSLAELLNVFKDVPAAEVERTALSAGVPIIDLLVQTGVVTSKGNARRMLEQGAIYLNNVRVAEMNRAITTADLLFDTILVLRSGKKEYRLVRVK